MKRRQLLRSLVAAAPSLPLASAFAQDPAYPTKPIRILATTAPGTLVDQAARLYAEKMGPYFKQSIIVDNVTGGSTAVAARQVVRAVPDGYTLMAAANTVITAPLIMSNPGYGPGDFTPLGELARAPTILVVSASSPFKSMKELIAAARAKPGEISYGSSGIGASNHLPVEMIARQAKVNLTHVPYKGISLAVPDVTAGRVTFMLAASNSIGELIKSGALRPLAISTPTRSPKFPDVPTLTEEGLSDGTYAVWIGLFGPPRMPAAVVARIAQGLEATRADPDVIARIEGSGQSISDVRTPQQFTALVRGEEQRLRKIVKEASIRVD